MAATLGTGFGEQPFLSSSFHAFGAGLRPCFATSPIPQNHPLTPNNAKPLEQCNALWYANSMAQSTITDRFQTTIPLDVREALNLKPRQRVSYEVRTDGSAIIRPIPALDELFGSITLGKPVASIREEKEAARKAIAQEVSRKGTK